MKELRNRVQGMTTEEIREFEKSEELVFQEVVLKPGDILVSRDAKEGQENVASSGQVTVVLNTNLTSELRLEGLAREFVNRVQKLRKDHDFHVSDRISVKFMTACPKISTAISDHNEYVKSETLALELEQVMEEGDLELDADKENLGSIEISDKPLVVSLKRIESQ
jgi:isoleucyl-tRNA synthetase